MDTNNNNSVISRSSGEGWWNKSDDITPAASWVVFLAFVAAASVSALIRIFGAHAVLVEIGDKWRTISLLLVSIIACGWGAMLMLYIFSSRLARAVSIIVVAAIFIGAIDQLFVKSF